MSGEEVVVDVVECPDCKRSFVPRNEHDWYCDACDREEYEYFLWYLGEEENEEHE